MSDQYTTEDTLWVWEEIAGETRSPGQVIGPFDYMRASEISQ